MGLDLSIKFMKKIEKLPSELKDTLYSLLEEIERHRVETVDKADFNELKGIVKELAEAQKQTKQQVKELAEAQKRTEQQVKELAEAQKRTEQQVKELTQAQKRTEQQVKELTQAQKRTEQQVKELAEAQKRTEQQVKELTQAQKRTEQKVDKLSIALEELTKEARNTQRELGLLVKEHQKTREQLGGLSMSFGYLLEDRAYRSLPALLQRDFGMKLIDRLKRTHLYDSFVDPIEVNIFGRAEMDGQMATIIGESKAQLSRKHIDSFLRKKIKPLERSYKNIFKVLVTFMVSGPDVESYAKEKGIALYYSYDFSENLI